MKTFTFIYDPSLGSTPETCAQIERAMKSGVPENPESGQLRSGSLKALLSIATENRIHMFYEIARSTPNSLLELSQVLEKDQAYVVRETRVLAGLGLIELKRVNEGRTKIKPVAIYDRIVIDFGKR